MTIIRKFLCYLGWHDYRWVLPFGEYKPGEVAEVLARCIHCGAKP